MSSVPPTPDAGDVAPAQPPDILARAQAEQSVSDYLNNYLNRLRAGDFGILPIVVGIVFIAVIFQILNGNYLTPHNIVNLIVQMAGVTAIAYGIVFVLLLGEVDLSVGFVSGVGGVTMAMLLLPDGSGVWLQAQGGIQWYLIGPAVLIFLLAIRRVLRNNPVVQKRLPWVYTIPLALLAAGISIVLTHPSGSLPWYVAVPIALTVTTVIGMLQGTLISFFQLPSFVVTLAGLLAWNGVVLLVIGEGGTVIIQDKTINAITDTFLSPAVGWIVWAVLIGAFAALRFMRIRDRRKKELSVPPLQINLLIIGILAVVSGFVVFWANRDYSAQQDLQRGVPLIAIILILILAALTFLVEQTRFGRYVYAIGGNKEAARRAGIKVEQIRVTVFMICSFMAGIGGIILATRLRSVDTNQGGGNLLLNAIASAVIGGTSLFGGRGKIWNAVIGALIISMIANGMGLLGLTSAIQFIITGIVLLLAVILDAISRRNQQRSGLA